MSNQTAQRRRDCRKPTFRGLTTRTLLAIACAGIVAAGSPGFAEQRPTTQSPKPQAAPDRTAPERPKRPAEIRPLCRDVGGYSAYLKRTGKICRLSGEEFNNPGYRGFR